MTKELQSTNIATITSMPVTPVKAAPKRKRRTGLLTKDDPLFRSIGSGKSGIPGGISGRKYDYFRKAFGSSE